MGVVCALQTRFQSHSYSIKGAEEPFSGMVPACETIIAYWIGFCNSLPLAAAPRSRHRVMATKDVITLSCVQAALAPRPPDASFARST
jgi:hypothetical protein